jgi:hypothetical protein
MGKMRNNRSSPRSLKSRAKAREMLDLNEEKGFRNNPVHG